MPIEIETQVNTKSTEGTPNIDTVLFAKGMLHFPVKQGATYRVYAFKDNIPPYKSSFRNGWTHQAHVAPEYGPEGSHDLTAHSTDNVCMAAATGALIGTWLPGTKQIESILSSTDLDVHIIGDLHLKDTLKTVFSSSFPVGITENKPTGNESWIGIAPFNGWLVLLMNDGIITDETRPTGHSDNDGAIIVNVSGE